MIMPARGSIACPCCATSVPWEMPKKKEPSPTRSQDVGGNLPMSSKLIARKISDDKTEAIRVADDQQRSSAVDVDREGNLRHSIAGKSPKGEEGSSAVCALLVE